MIRNELGTMPLAMPGVLAGLEHASPSTVSGHQATQRGGQPQPLVVLAAGVEAHHQRDVAEPVAVRLEVRVKVRAARLLGLSPAAPGTARACRPPRARASIAAVAA